MLPMRALQRLRKLKANRRNCPAATTTSIAPERDNLRVVKTKEGQNFGLSASPACGGQARGKRVGERGRLVAFGMAGLIDPLPRFLHKCSFCRYLKWFVLLHFCKC